MNNTNNTAVGNQRPLEATIMQNNNSSKNKKIILPIIALLSLILFFYFLISFALSSNNDKDENSEEMKKIANVQHEAFIGDLGNSQNSIQQAQKEIVSEEEEKERLEELQKKESAKIETPEPKKEVDDLQLPSDYAVESGNSNEKVLTPTERKKQGNTLIVIQNSSSSRQTDDDNTNNSPMVESLKGDDYANGAVTKLADIRFLLSRGSVLPCVLKTKIITDYPSLPICTLTKDVYSSNGEVLLLRAGTQFFGEQKKVVRQGQTRVFVSWNTAQDGNIRIKLDSLGVDKLGASGLPAWIDNHYLDRFGSAIFVSFVDDLLKAGTSHLAKKGENNNNNYFSSSTNNVDEMAKMIVENNINIPATAYINQGEMLNILVPRDIDFKKVYKTIRKRY